MTPVNKPGAALAAHLGNSISEGKYIGGKLSQRGFLTMLDRVQQTPGMRTLNLMRRDKEATLPSLALAAIHDKVVGVMVRFSESEQVFLARDPEMPPDMVVEQIAALADRQLELVNGEVHSIGNRVRSLGVFDEVEDPSKAASPAASFEIGDWDQEGIRTLENTDDSYGKAMWRRTLERMGITVFPEGRRGIHKKDGIVVMMPGAVGGHPVPVKEVLTWTRLGFKIPRDFIFIESNHRVSGPIERSKLYGKVPIVKKRFERPNQHRDAVEGIWGAMPYERSASVISLDPNNNLTRPFADKITDLFCRVPLGEDCVVAVNFSTGRENASQWSTLEEFAGKKLEDLKGDTHALHTAAVSNVIPYAVRKALHRDSAMQRPTRIVDEHTVAGSYMGNTHGTRMYYSMHHLTRRK
jgi:hypothetical protein